MPHTEDTDLAVVVPAYYAAAYLRNACAAWRQLAREVPLVVVDAGSGDDTADVAASLGARVIRLPKRAGPAEARNAGAEATQARVLLFIDADCIPHADVPARVRAAFEANAELVSLTGSYDDDPRAPGLVSQYMNLRHHHTHQQACREPATYWAGCGAVRRDAFLAVGGFDVERYPRPAVEDIELGWRLRRVGRTRLDPDLQVTHQKQWTLRSVVETDILCRAVPWARLVRETGELPDDLNLRMRQRVAVAWAPIALLCVPGLAWGAAAGSLATVLACVGGVAGSVALDPGLYRFFARRRGVGFAAGAWLLHQLHLVYSGVAFAVTLALHRPAPRSTRDAADRSG